MRVHGYCESCRRFRPVSVSGAGLAMLAVGGVAVGVCDDCERGPTYRVIGRSGPIGRGMTLDQAERLARVSGCRVEKEER